MRKTGQVVDMHVSPQSGLVSRNESHFSKGHQLKFMFWFFLLALSIAVSSEIDLNDHLAALSKAVPSEKDLNDHLAALSKAVPSEKDLNDHLAALSKAVPSEKDLNDYWGVFKKVFQKLYSEAEEETRRQLFENNVQNIINHNLLADLGQHSYRLGINRFTDSTEAERSRLSNYDSTWDGTQESTFEGTQESTFEAPQESTFEAPPDLTYPDEVDWRKEGYVTPVKNQEDCGSCWAFSAAGSLEGQYKKKTGVLVPLSEQNLIDCSKVAKGGCHGSTYFKAFEYMKNNNGIETEKSYPYEAKNEKCRFNPDNVGATIRGYVQLPKKNESALLKAVATVGPISAHMAVLNDYFSYKSGIYDSKNCSAALSVLNHAVLVVGYGAVNGKEYWLVKNSWGVNWGEHGYFRIARNQGNECGIADSPGYPLV